VRVCEAARVLFVQQVVAWPVRQHLSCDRCMRACRQLTIDADIMSRKEHVLSACKVMCNGIKAKNAQSFTL